MTSFPSCLTRLLGEGRAGTVLLTCMTALPGFEESDSEASRVPSASLPVVVRLILVLLFTLAQGALPSSPRARKPSTRPLARG